MKSKLGQLNSGIDPELLMDGMTIAGAYIESGVRKFADYAQAMVEDLGEGVKPYLLSFWEGARAYPGLDTTGMTSAEESAKQHAALLTPAVIDRAEAAIGEVVEKPTTKTRKTGAKGDMVLTQDWGVEYIDGYGTSDDRETGNDTKDAFLKEARTYLNAVGTALASHGFTTHTDGKGRPEKAVSVSEGGAAVSGDVSLTMRNPDTGENVYVTIGGSALRGTVPTTQSGIAIMWRKDVTEDRYAARATNRWAKPDMSANELASGIVASSQKLTEQTHADKLVELAKQPHGRYLGDVADALQKLGWTPHQRRALLYRIRNIPDSDDQLSLLIRNPNNNTNVRVTMGSKVGLTYTLSTVTDDVLLHEGIPAVVVSEGVPADELARQINARSGKAVSAPPAEKKPVRLNRTSRLTQHWGVGLDDWGSVKERYMQDAQTYLHSIAKILQERGFQPHRDGLGRNIGPVDRIVGNEAARGSVFLLLRHKQSEQNLYVDIDSQVFNDKAPRTDDLIGVAVSFGKAKEKDTHLLKSKAATKAWAPVDLDATQFADMITAKMGLKAEQSEQGEGNERAAVRDDGQETLANVAAGESRSPESRRSAGTGFADGRETGVQSGRGTDGAGVSTARSGRGRADGVRDAATGDRSGNGTLGAGRGSDVGSPVSQDEDGRVTASGAPAGAPNIPASNFQITDDTRLGQGGEVQKFNDNLAAIRTLKKIEAEHRRATPEEQTVLARYVGWGGLANAFPDPTSGQFKDKWQARGDELRALLTDDEYKAARRSTRNAHYTAETVVSAMWKAVERLGFKGGLVLESSMGVGNFLGLAPSNLPARFIGVEYDSLTARLAGALYPQATVLHAGFQQVPVSDDAFALNIGNPPFGSESLRFQFKPELQGVSIHNQFFRAGMDALRPGGIQAMVVSRYLMDAKDKASRLALARQAKLVGLIRLPDTAFKENARTEVVTDIVILQKLTADEQDAMNEAVNAYLTPVQKNQGKEMERQALAAKVPLWVETTEVPDPLGGEVMTVNAHFRANPEDVLGRLERSGSMAHGADMTVRLDNPAELADLLDKAVARLPQNIQNFGAEVLESTESRFKSMSDALRIALARQEPGHVSLESDGKLYRVIERETPEGGYEYLRQEITADSPWSDQLSMDASGHWYRLEVKTDEAGNVVKFIKDGKATSRNVYERTTYANDQEIPASLRLGKAGFERLKAITKLRDLLKRQLVLETADAAKAVMEGNRKSLAAAYAEFVAQHGPLNRPINLRLAMTMPDGGLTTALEVAYQPARSAAQAAKTGLDVQEEIATPAPILRERVVQKYEPAAKAETPADALAINLAESGRVDLERIGQLLGVDADTAAARLQEGDSPLVFQDPETQQWETANAYLSGMVKRKLQAARAAGLTANVAALEKVIPEDWSAENVTVQLGSTWVPAQTYEEFIEHLTGGQAKVHFSVLTNAFAVSAPSGNRRDSQWGTEDASVEYLISRLLNSQSVTITRTDSNGNTYVDKEATALAGLKSREIVNEFGDWVFKDADRRAKLVEIFNERYNTRVVRQYDGQHLTLPGKVPDTIIKLRRHQMNAVWRGIYERFMLMDHAVGAGKTFTAIARAMERRRMGLSRKPMVVVPNHLVEQWAADVYRLYPAAKVLAAGKKDFEAKRRRRLFGKIATGDWDIVIVPHSSFGFIGIAPETEARYLEQELRDAMAAIEDAWEQAKEDGNDTGRRKPFGVKEAERLAEKIQGRMEVISAGARDRLLTFEQLGVDDLTIDEAHEFKNLNYSSRLTGVRGMGDKSGSRKANDLYNKVRVLRDSPTATVTFLTGTPISNSAVEMFTILRYLAADSLEEMGMTHFDAFRAQFVEATPAFEPTESGRLKEVTRLGRTWSNMRALMDLYYQVTDAVSLDDIKSQYAADNKGAPFPVPKVKGGKDRQLVTIQPTPAQVTALKEIMDGFDSLDSIEDPYERNAERLRLMDRARKVSLDVRAVSRLTNSTEPGGKLQVVSENIKRIYDATAQDLGTQLVFLDRSVPKAKGDEKILKEYDALVAKRDGALRQNDMDAFQEATDALEKYDANEIAELREAQTNPWNGYLQIKENLVAMGIPANEVRFVQEANNDEQKAALFDAVNGGKVRVLIGSTPRMGAGTNVQQRAVALHHVDVTWKPSDIEQREGRVIRQGNKLLEKYGPDFEVEILAYATERTVDAKMWDLNATKLRTINGIRKYDGAFSMEFEDEEAVGMAEMAALASGNPLLLERVKLESEIGNLELQERAHRRKMYGVQDALATARRRIERNPALIEVARERTAEARRRVAELGKRASQRTVTVEGQQFDNLRDALQATEDAIQLQQAGNEKARYAITIDGQRITTKDGITEAIGAALGDNHPFEATINGKTTYQRTAAARQIAELLNGTDTTEDGTTVLPLGEMFGYQLEADIDVSTVRVKAKSGETTSSRVKNVRFSLLDNGKTVASADTAEFSATANLLTQNIRPSVDRLMEAVSRSANSDEAGYLSEQLERAQRDLAELEARVGEAFPKAAELTGKRERLTEVVKELEGKAVTPAEQDDSEQAPPSEARFSFAGVSARVADRHALATAQQRLQQGDNPEQVRQDTGWHRGVDGKWRFEISDDQAKLSVAGSTAGAIIDMGHINALIQERDTPTVGDVIDHPQLFAAYPAAARIEITTTPAGVTAAARLRRTAMGMRVEVRAGLPRADVVSAVLHELQHAIQYREGFASGGSSKALATDLDPSGMATYRRLAGEVEARNTQARQGMTDTERRATSPQMTADTADSEVLVTFNGRDLVSDLANVPASSPATQRSIKAVRNTVEAVRKLWRNGPAVAVVWDIDDPQVPQAIQQAQKQARARGEVGKPEGVWYQGRVYLFASELATPAAVIRTLLHETYGHHGLRGAFGADLVAVLDQIIAARPADIQDKVAEYQLDDTLNGRRQAAEELLAVMAQTNPQLGWVRNAVAAIRSFLRKLGLNVFQLSNDEIIRNYLIPARQFVIDGARDMRDGVSQSSRAYDGASPFSRASVGQMANKVAGQVNKALSAPGKLSWWHKTVGTMYNLGQRNPHFKKVYRVAQGYLDDVSHYANDAAERAPTLLPRLDTWADIFKASISAADNKAVAAPVFEGTLLWMRDSNGHPVKVEDVAASYAGLSADDKAQLMIQAGKLSVGMYNAWAQHPNFADMVETRFKATMLKAGVVWSDTELRTLFSLTDAQIALYREFRDTTDRSLDTMTRSDMIRFAGDDLKHMQSQVMAAQSARHAVRLMMVELANISQSTPNRAGMLAQLAHGLRERLQKLESLQAEGYAPLSRFGKYTVTVRDAQTNEVEYFGLYETAYEGNIAAEQLAAAYPTSRVNQGTLSDEKYKLYAGITPETLELFGQALSYSATGDNAEDLAFQELLRLTKNNRSAMKRLIHRQGIAGYSEDVGRVLASFTYSNARHTAAGLHMGDLKKAVEAIPQEQGELTDAAQQLAEYVQNPQEEAQAIRGMLFAQYLGGSIAAAMVNMTQPLAVTFPWLSQYGGAKQAAAQLTKAAKQMATRGYRYEPQLAVALKQAEDDGIVSPQEIHQLMAQARGRGAMRAGDGTRVGDARATAANAVARLMVAWGKPFGAAEQVNRRMTFIAAFRIAIERGNPPKRAAAFARKAVTETQFTYSKAAKMKWGRGAVGGTLMTFKTYSVAYLELGHRLWNQGQPGSVERKAGRKAVLLMMATLMLLGGAGGLPFAEDAEDLLDGLAQLGGYNFSAKQAREEFLNDLIGQDAARLFNKGLTGLPGMPVDVAGRLGMGNLIPGTGLLKTSRDHTSDVLEMVGPVGDFAKRLAKGAGMVASGDVLDGLLEASPTAVRNLAKGVDMAATDMYRDQKGYKIIDTDLGDALSKGVGFQPNDVARIQEANRYAQSTKAFYNLRAQEIRALWAAGIFEGDQEMVRQARAQVADWNAKNPEQRMVIRMPDVMRRVREMRKSKDQRIAATAPKSMRQQMREQSANLHQELDD
ncbi:MAG: PLxRFG domain-containing protein [Aeromonas veronii]